MMSTFSAFNGGGFANGYSSAPAQLPHQEPVVADVVEAVLLVTINKIKRKNEKNI